MLINFYTADKQTICLVFCKSLATAYDLIKKANIDSFVDFMDDTKPNLEYEVTDFTVYIEDYDGEIIFNWNEPGIHHVDSHLDYLTTDYFMYLANAYKIKNILFVPNGNIENFTIG